MLCDIRECLLLVGKDNLNNKPKNVNKIILQYATHVPICDRIIRQAIPHILI